MRLDTAFGCVAVALLLQVVANFANDLSDFRRGADTPDRQGPLRVAAAGLVTERQLEVAIGFTIGLAGVVGLWLAYVGGPVLILLGVLAVVAALAYTGGPWPYGYRGLGEVFVFVFFGLVAVVGTAYLQTRAARGAVLGRGDPGGRADHRDPRRQQPARHPDGHGRGQAHARGDARASAGRRRSTRCCSASAYVVPRGLLRSAGQSWLVLAPLLSLPAGGAAAPDRAWRSATGGELNPVLKGTARLALVFALLFAAGLAAP